MFATTFASILFTTVYLQYVTAGIDWKCLKCICQVESNCRPLGCSMDVGSLSCGYYQIKQPYYIDCYRPGSGWQSCSKDLSCSGRCVRAYMDRYGKYCTGGREPTCRDYARIHNGGPRGCQKSSTLDYSRKVLACVAKQPNVY